MARVNRLGQELLEHAYGHTTNRMTDDIDRMRSVPLRESCSAGRAKACVAVLPRVFCAVVDGCGALQGVEYFARTVMMARKRPHLGSDEMR